MDNLIFSAKTVLPLLLLMAVGFLFRCIGMLNDKLVKQINQLVFRCFLPCSLFISLENASADTKINGRAFYLVAGGLICIFILLMLIIPVIEKDRKKVGVMVQGILRANYAIFGVPLVQMLFPGQDTSLAALFVAATVPFYNILSVIALSVYCGGEVNWKKILLNILKNPLIISCAIGLLFFKLQWHLPELLEGTVKSLGSVATPLALFTLGASIQFSSVVNHKKQLTIGVLGKLVINPAIFLTLAALLGLHGVEMGCILVAFGAPTAVSSFPMAVDMGGDEKLAAEQVAFTTAFSILSVFLIIFVLKTLNLI